MPAGAHGSQTYHIVESLINKLLHVKMHVPHSDVVMSASLFSCSNYEVGLPCH